MVVTFLSLISAFLFSAAITFFITPWLRSVAFKTGIVDTPDGLLKNHERPVAYLGGVAVFLGSIVSCYFFLAHGLNSYLFFIGLTILLLVGLIDDVYAISPLKKFLGQICACLFFLKAGLFFKEQFFLDLLPHSLHSPRIVNCLAIGLSSGWMLTVINAFNLIDIMDGLAIVVSFVGATSFCIIAMLSGNYLLAVLMSSLCGSLAGFFWYNKPRACMYLGDAGSLFIGGVLATAPFFLHWGSYDSVHLITPFFLLFVPLLEVAALIVIRSWKKIPFYYGSPHHFVSYFKRRGYSVRKILAISFATSSVSGAIGLVVAFRHANFFSALGVLFTLMLLWGYFVYCYQNKSFFLKKRCFFFY